MSNCLQKAAQSPWWAARRQRAFALSIHYVILGVMALTAHHTSAIIVSSNAAN